MIAALEAAVRGDFQTAYRLRDEVAAKGPYVIRDRRGSYGVPPGSRTAAAPGAHISRQSSKTAAAIRLLVSLDGRADWPAAAGRLCDVLEQNLAENQEKSTDRDVEEDHRKARAHFHRGLRLVAQGRVTEGLEAVDAGLFAAERARQQAGVSGHDFSWLRSAPRSLRLIAPDWTAAAVCAMRLHDAAGRFQVAADAGNIAVRVSGGMAALDMPGCRELYTAVLAAAKQVWSHAENPVLAALEGLGPNQEVMIAGGNVLHVTPGPAELAELDRALEPDDEADQ